MGGGATGLSGPPVVLLWVGGQDNAPQVRANLVAYFCLLTPASVASLVVSGLITRTRLIEALLLAPAFALAALAGTWMFARASDRLFRHAAFLLCAFAALAGLPLWRHL